MPTVGWIMEGDFDRLVSATQTVPDPTPGDARPTLRCPFCSATFLEARERGDHLSTSHGGTRPFLSIGGSEPAKEHTFHQPLLAPAILLSNSTAVKLSINGGPWEHLQAQELGDVLAKQDDSRLKLRLCNLFEHAAEPIVTEYDLRFQVISPSRLADADRLFVKHLGSPGATMAAVDRYLQEIGPGPVSLYAGALADYVVAVLKKDVAPGMFTSPEPYRAIFDGALRVLNDFDRPLPTLLCSLMKFGANDFSSPSGVVNFPPLRRASKLLRSLETGQNPLTLDAEPDDDGKRVDVCPIDAGTDNVLRQSDQLASLRRWSRAIEDRLRAEADLASIDPLDRVKLLALWAATALRLAGLERAREPLRLLDGNDRFGDWAAAQLKEHNL